MKIEIVSKDKATADRLRQELASRNIETRFGMRAGPIEASPAEIIELTRFAPESIDILFNTIEKFKDRCYLLVDGKKEEPARLRTSLREPKIFQQLFGRK